VKFDASLGLCRAETNVNAHSGKCQSILPFSSTAARALLKSPPFVAAVPVAAGVHWPFRKKPVLSPRCERA
jgi:hypothetical protein